MMSRIALIVALFAVLAPALASWERFFTLRDTTNYRRQNRPAGGWFVSPVHQHLLPSGKVLVNAWVRSSEFNNGCELSHGSSFLMDPDELVGRGSRRTKTIQPLDEKPKLYDNNYMDTTTFSGHATLPDGKKFHFGGSRFHLPSANWGRGIDYAHIYDPETNSWSVVSEPNPTGTAWYPTVVALPDQRMLVATGFWQCCTEQASTALATFDYQRFKNGRSSPWALIYRNNEEGSNPDMKMTSADYIRLHVLHEPVVVDGLARQVITMGAKGRMSFFNTDEMRPKTDRFVNRPNSRRPRECGMQTTAAVVATGEIMVVGGCDSSMIDLYNPVTDRWRTIDSGIIREFGTALLLPNGNVLIINGENRHINQNTGVHGGRGDPRTPQIFDPFTNDIVNLDVEPGDGPNHPNQGAFRGYHSTATLLHSGSVLIGGGRHAEGRIGCEHASTRIFNPPYTEATQRPEISSIDSSAEIPTLRMDDPTSFLRLQVKNAGSLLASASAPNSRSGAALVAMGSITHAYDQNQRYVPLRFEVDPSDANHILVYAPSAPQGIPGDYLLHIVGADLTPSKGHTVRLLPSLGEWKRTVIYVSAALPAGHRLHITGGHDAQILDKYRGRDWVSIAHKNVVGQLAENKGVGRLKWGETSVMAYTASRASRADWFNQGRLYTREGWGADPENMIGANVWKFEAYMHVEAGDDVAFREWFEFRVLEESADGSMKWEREVTHRTVGGGLQPPATSGNHFARIGHVTMTTLGGNDAGMYDLNEVAVPQSTLPYEPYTLSPTTSPSRSPTASPSTTPTASPSLSPSTSPSLAPSASPSRTPTTSPSVTPTTSPTKQPTASPTRSPSEAPTVAPSVSPTLRPTSSPTMTPTTGPSASPSTAIPSASPSSRPTASPSRAPTQAPLAASDLDTNSNNLDGGADAKQSLDAAESVTIAIAGATGGFLLLVAVASALFVRAKRRAPPTAQPVSNFLGSDVASESGSDSRRSSNPMYGNDVIR